MASLAHRRRALQAADDLQNELGLDQEQPINVFDVVDELGLWLAFNHLDNLLGAVVPRGDGGIMISTQRGAAVQRYTAAHEIGHWILDVGEAAFDTEDDIYYPTEDRELLAQLFAGQFLMPPPLVYETCRRYGVNDSETAAPTGVYQAARDMGTSFEATVRQLSNLGIIDPPTQNRLIRIQPSAIKAGLGLGHHPKGAVDVWPATFASNDDSFRVTEGDEVLVSLPENRTTGYRWLTAQELEARTRRVAAHAPPLLDSAVAPETIATWAPPTDQRSASAVRRAVGRLPGSGEAKRILAVPPDPVTSEASILVDQADDALASRPASLEVVDDTYHASWTDAARSSMRTIRRAIAGLNTAGGRGEVIPPPTVSGTGTRLVALRSYGEGLRPFALYYTSAYEPDAPVVEEYSLQLEIGASPALLRRRRLIVESQEDPDSDEGEW